MNLKLWYNLRQIRKIGLPRADFKKALWRDLSGAWPTTGFPNFAWYQQPYFRYAVVALVIMVFSALGTSAFAYTNPKIITGNMLYPLKQKIEKIEEKIKLTPEAKAKFYLKQLDKREAEKTVLINLKKDTVSTEKKIEVIEKNLEKSDEWFKKKQINNPQLQKKIEEKLENRKEFSRKQLEKTIEEKQKNSGEKENENEKNIKNNNFKDSRGRAD